MRRAFTHARLACSRWTAEATSEQHLAVTSAWRRRLHFKMKKHQYLKNVKRVRYVSCIPQYTGPLGRQTKKRAIIRDYRKSPRLRIFKRER
mmetsp:Transcript_74248/g.240090  ORF Transcript_74248/g.240090 Transcript_74248/m.240090 type:complete len:91 (-) Transcript_74248:94-366(-)